MAKKKVVTKSSRPKKAAAPAKKVPAAEGTKKKARKPPAKAGAINKSQAIRDYKAKHPKAGPTEIAKALAEKGIKVAPAMVSNVTSTKKKKASKKATKRKAAHSTASETVNLNDLVDAARFAEKVGGLESAKELLSAVDKLSGK